MNIDDLKNNFPLCREYCKELFDDVCYHILIQNEMQKKFDVPLEEFCEFLCKGKIKFEFLKKKEEELRTNGRNKEN